MSADARRAIETDDFLALQEVIRDGIDVHLRYTERNSTLLMLAARLGNTKAAECLLEAGLDPNAVDTNGETALMFAAGARCSDVVCVLLTAGAEVNKTDVCGRTALHHALESAGNESRLAATVRELLDAGADTTIPDLRGTSARRVAGRRKWVFEVPFFRWQITGWYRVLGGDVLRMLSQAERARSNVRR
jgi:ankyrin repeat protein